jgi:N-acetylglucosamine-6-sulfatase
MYTGQYNSKNGVKLNTDKLLGTTIFDDLAPRYLTGLVGKYLNSWDAFEPLPALDWSAIVPKGHASYGRQTFQVNGELRTSTKIHNSKLMVDFAFEFLDAAQQQEQPFFLVLAFAAPHFPAKPSSQDVNRFNRERIRRAPSYLKANDQKPRYVLSNFKKARFRQQSDTKFLRRQANTLFGLDRELARLYEKVDFKETIVIFISDSGLMHGEHGLFSKGFPYQEAIRVPMLIRYDPLTANATVYKNLVSHVDLTATLYELTNSAPSRQIDGISLVPTFYNSSQSIRQSILLEGWKGEIGEIFRSNYVGILTNDRIKLIRNQNDRGELYDLNRDPYEIRNAYYLANARNQRELHEAELDKILLGIRGKVEFD